MHSLFFRRRGRRLRLLSLYLALLLALPVTALFLTGGAARPVVSTPSCGAKGAILINGDTGEVYFERNAHARLPMASTTKIMTALVAIEALPIETEITVAPEAVGVEGSSVYLYAGEKMTLEALLYALMLESANDAAAAIAYGVAGSIEAFAELMNEKAASMGLTDTHFENPHGLDGKEHYTSAHDLAVISAAALKCDAFRAIVSTYKKTVPQKETDGVRLLINHNRLLRSYEGCIGVKTGYTKRSGRCLVTAAERNGLRLVAVTLSDPDDWADHTAMLDYGFSLYESIPLTDGGRISFTLPVLNGISPTAEASYETADGLPLRVTLPKDHGEITTRVELPRHLWGDYAAGTEIGRLRFFCDGKQICSVPLSLDADVFGISYRFHLLKRILALFAAQG